MRHFYHEVKSKEFKSSLIYFFKFFFFCRFKNDHGDGVFFFFFAFLPLYFTVCISECSTNIGFLCSFRFSHWNLTHKDEYNVISPL